MADRPEHVEFKLLDWHLQQLDAEEASQVQGAVMASPELGEKDHRLQEVLALLDRCEVPVAPLGLADRVLSRVQSQPQAESPNTVYPFEKPAPVFRAESIREISARAVLSLRELVAIAACITLFFGIFVPGYSKAKSLATRNRCLSNLQQVWTGASTYAAANNDQLAHVGFFPGASWLSTKTPNVERYSNTAPMYALLKNGYLRDARVFVCPAASHARVMRPEDGEFKAFKDFAEPCNTTYSYIFSNTPKPIRLAQLEGRLGLAGDRNPLLDNWSAGMVNPYDDASGNSTMHGNGGAAGQNVVFVNGQAGWFRQPTVGVDNDNVYRAGSLPQLSGTEEPVCSTDTLLIP
ncbi:MAG: hypothetical protein FWC56_00200 [Phycisphaerae bacterium]|nr:hypothetical protein [Phycisphaerae bacterium]